MKVTGFADRKQQKPSPASPRRENGRSGSFPEAKLKNQTGQEVEKLLKSGYHSLMLCLFSLLPVRVKSFSFPIESSCHDSWSGERLAVLTGIKSPLVGLRGGGAF